MNKEDKEYFRRFFKLQIKRLVEERSGTFDHLKNVNEQLDRARELLDEIEQKPRKKRK